MCPRAHCKGIFKFPCPSTFRAPIQLEIQIWAAAIMDLNDVSHWQYEVARAGSVGAF